jgi:hypothetical protein
MSLPIVLVASPSKQPGKIGKIERNDTYRFEKYR